MIHCIIDIGKAYNIVGLGPFYDFVRGVAGYTERDLTLPQSLTLLTCAMIHGNAIKIEYNAKDHGNAPRRLFSARWVSDWG
jgi:hypothetical protein